MASSNPQRLCTHVKAVVRSRTSKTQRGEEVHSGFADFRKKNHFSRQKKKKQPKPHHILFGQILQILVIVTYLLLFLEADRWELNQSQTGVR